jgi:alanyl-tRNA synthetase
VRLDRTAFYAESGGQPWDTGTLDGVAVVAVVEDDGEVLHVLERPLEAERVEGRVDGERRRDHRQQHHGQHLLSRAFVELHGARTVSFHLGAEASTIDLDRQVAAEAVWTAETRANEVVWEGRPVKVRVVSRTEARARGVEAPEDAGDLVRLVEVRGFDLQACGGTHPRTTAEVGVVVVLGQERYKGGSRVRFVCGHRALAAVRARTAVLDRLGALFSSPLEGLPEAAARALDELADLTRRARDLTERALEAEARRLLADAGAARVVTAVYDGWPPADLRTLAQHVVRLAPALVLLGSRSEKAHVVIAQSEGGAHDLAALLRAALEPLGGRGGGKGNLVQGGADRSEGLSYALEAAAALIRSSRA